LELAIPVFKITEDAFETLLEQLGTRSQDLLYAPPALPLNAHMQQTLVRSPLTTTLTANVVGLWSGSDPDLADEVILVGAHYDHIGQSPDGLYFPGANQNASGVGSLLEMARVWQSAGYRPARSVLFVAWGAEELDGAGVTHYLAHPAVPLTRTVAVIALDSIGGGREYKLLFYTDPDHDLPLAQRLEASASQLDRRAWRRSATGEGWHTFFRIAGIPTAKLIWSEAERDFYVPTDTVDHINLDYLTTSGEIFTLVVSWLAGQ
jgi:Zn-dependent M28 family amino/carboxypeptidase